MATACGDERVGVVGSTDARFRARCSWRRRSERTTGRGRGGTRTSPPLSRRRTPSSRAARRSPVFSTFTGTKNSPEERLRRPLGDPERRRFGLVPDGEQQPEDDGDDGGRHAEERPLRRRSPRMARYPGRVRVLGPAHTTTLPAAPPMAAGRASTTTRERETGQGSQVVKKQERGRRNQNGDHVGDHGLGDRPLENADR